MAKKVTERVIEIDARGAENTIRALREEVRKLTEVQKDLDMESAEFRDISSELTAAQTKLRNAVQGNTAAVEGSYKAYSHQLQVLKEHRKWIAEGTDEYRKATEEISKLDQKLKDMDAEIGVFGRNVGNYASAFEGLNGGVQQVAQGIPELVNGSQNLFGIVRSSIPTIIKSAESIGEVSAEGSKASSVVKALGRSILSWQTLLVAGVALLSEYGGKIIEWVKNLGRGRRELTNTEKALRKFNDAAREEMKSVGADIYLLKRLASEWASLGDSISAKEQFIRDNVDAFDDLGFAVRSVIDAEDLLAKRTPQYIEALKARAQAAAAQKMSEEYYADALSLELKIREYGLLFSEEMGKAFAAEDSIDRDYWSKEAEKSQNAIADLNAQRKELVEIADFLFGKADSYTKYANELTGNLSKTTTPHISSNTPNKTKSGGYNYTPSSANRSRLSIPTLGGLAINEGATIEANKARLAALAQMEGASAEERKAIEQSLQEELALIEQMRLETHEIVLQEMLRSDELSTDERIALEEELTANQVAQAQLRAKAAEEQAKAEKKAAEEVMAIEKKKDQLKQQIMSNASTMLKNFASTLDENAEEYKGIQSAAVVIDTIAAAMAGYKQGMTYGGPAAPFLAAFNLATAITTGAAQLHALWNVKTDGSNADSALSSAQVPNVASSMPASYTRNLMGDNELSELNKDMRVYVVEQDITDAQKKAKTREESASF